MIDFNPDYSIFQQSTLRDLILILRFHPIRLESLQKLPIPIPESLIQAAIGQLQRIGSLDKFSRITDFGRKMLNFPLGLGSENTANDFAQKPELIMHCVLTMLIVSSDSEFLVPEKQEFDCFCAESDLVSLLTLPSAFEFKRETRNSWCSFNRS
jgi:HrpA-like RNA helicase